MNWQFEGTSFFIGYFLGAACAYYSMRFALWLLGLAIKRKDEAIEEEKR